MKKPFRKIELLVHHRDKAKVTKSLQDLGVVHLNINDDYRNESIDQLEDRKGLLIKVLERLQPYVKKNGMDSELAVSSKISLNTIAQEVLKREAEVEKGAQVLETLKKVRSQYDLLGELDLRKMTRLKKAGVTIAVYVSDRKSFEDYSFDDIICEILTKTKNTVHFAIFSFNKDVHLPFELIPLPEFSLEVVNQKERELQAIKEDYHAFMEGLINYDDEISNEVMLIDNQLQLLKAGGSFNEFNKGVILHLSGWYPQLEEGKITRFLEEGEWSFKLSDPTSNDDVPVLLDNPKYPKLFESITNIFQLPSYYEMDLTPLIAVFYPVLFAYCLGDAGYGLILLIASIIGTFTFLKDAKNMALLGIILGIFTTLMGLVKSGSVFGLPTITDDSNAFFNYLGQFVAIPDDRDIVFNAFNVALMIGVVQILVAIVISIINRIKYQSFVASLSQIGKLLIVFNLIWIFLADMQGVEALLPFSIVRQCLLIVGVVLVLFFHDLSASLIARPFSGLLPLFFIITGILGDVLSYVRLFALGVASSVLGLVVNQIGVQIMGDSWWQFFLGIIFLLIGHSLNLALATLGAFVHPLRLTFVEFYNNALFEGGGLPYKPFKKSDITS